MTTSLIPQTLLLLAILGRSAAPEEPERPPPPAVLKTPEAGYKFKEGMQKLNEGDYSAARSLFTACLKDASTPADRKVIDGLIEDTKMGSEIDAARKLIEQKNEKKALSKLETALKANPQGTLSPLARKVIRETEEVIYCVLDDFETGEGLESEPSGRDRDPRSPPGASSYRFGSNMSLNSDPGSVLHGTGSLKWKVGGNRTGGPPRRDKKDGPGGPPGRREPAGYRSAELKTPLTKTKWHTLVFYVYLPEVEDGALQVSLAASADSDTLECLSNRKPVDLRGKRGWLPVHLDLQKDFLSPRNAKLEDMRYVRIDCPQVNFRTIYLDFVHLE